MASLLVKISYGIFVFILTMFVGFFLVLALCCVEAFKILKSVFFIVVCAPILWLSFAVALAFAAYKESQLPSQVDPDFGRILKLMK